MHERRMWVRGIVVIGVIAAACSQGGEEAIPEAESAASRAAVEESLMQADRDFAAATQERGVDGWVSWFAPDGAMITARGEVKGHDAIRERMAPFLSDSGAYLRWEPTYARSGGGNLGYTIGTSRTEARDSTNTLLGTGNYLTVWRRQADGSWKVERDLGTYTPAETSE